MENNIGEQRVGVDELSDLFALSKRRIQQLAKTKVLPTIKERPYRFILRDAIQAYAKSLQINVEEGSLEERKLKAEVDLKETRAKIVQLEFDELEGRLHSSQDVETVVSDLIQAIRSGIVSLPGRVAFDVATEEDPALCSGIIRKACNDILRELQNHEYNPAAYKELVRKRNGYFNDDDEDE